MKFINKYIAFAAIVALLVTSCSKDESSSAIDDPAVQSVDLTFGAMLNDLANRAAEVNKNHFNQVPDCSDAEPAVARIGFSYGGNDFEADVDILSDESGYFTDYSEQLRIPVPNNSSVTVTLNSFMVYDGDPDGDGNLIWIAPIESVEGEFDGYVDNPLPFDFEVADGTKPYIDVEVLCFDRRMVNEYGYVFFDILPEVIYPLCLFVNYCDENGRHFVADYSVDLYFGTDDTGIQLYDHDDDATAMATTGDYGEGEYYAEPLCLVVPGPPANLASNQPYLYLVIYPEDWDGTGDIDNSPIGNIQLSWDMVNALLNDDGTTNEYLHLLIGECEGALTGDGNGGNGGDNDLDDDGVTNDIDQCPNTPANATVNAVGCPDTDGDGIFDNEDDCPNENPTTDVDGDGCEDNNGGGDPDCGTAYFGGETISTGFRLITATDFTIPLNVIVDASTVSSISTNVTIGTLDMNPTDGPEINVVINIENSSEWEVKDYVLTASTSETGSPSVVVEYDESGGDPGESFIAELPLGDLEGYDGTTLYLKAEFDVCEKQ